MYKYIITALTILFFAFSCNNKEPELVYGLDGNWSLRSISCECEPLNLEYGDHIWSLDTEENKLVVAHNIEEKSPMLLESGSYSVEINNTDSTILIEDILYTFRFRSGNLLVEDSPALDGPSIFFVRE